MQSRRLAYSGSLSVMFGHAASRGQRLLRDAVRPSSAAAFDQIGQPGHASSVRGVFNGLRGRPGAELRRRTPEGTRALTAGRHRRRRRCFWAAAAAHRQPRTVVCGVGHRLTRLLLCRRFRYGSARLKPRWRVWTAMPAPIHWALRFRGAVIVVVSTGMAVTTCVEIFTVLLAGMRCAPSVFVVTQSAALEYPCSQRYASLKRTIFIRDIDPEVCLS